MPLGTSACNGGGAGFSFFSKYSLMVLSKAPLDPPGPNMLLVEV